MKDRDFTRAFGNPDAAFSDTVEITLRRLLKEEEKPVRKLRIGAAVAIAACLLLAAVGVAAANHWGLFDFLGRYDAGVLPEALDIVATDVPQVGGETEYASFSLREAVYDGQQAYLLVDIKPKEGVLLLGVDSDPEYSMQDLTGEQSDLTIGGYAAANNLRMIYTNIGVSFEGGGSMDFHMEDDGTLVYVVQGAVPQVGADTLEMSVNCITFPADYTDFERDVRRAALTFTLNKAAALAAGGNSGGAEFPNSGVRVDSIELNATAMGLYYKIRYTVVDQAIFDALEGGLWFEILDENGEPMPGGAGGWDWSREDEHGGYVQEGSVAAVKQVPDSLTLRTYSAWTKDRCEVAEISITAK